MKELYARGYVTYSNLCNKPFQDRTRVIALVTNAALVQAGTSQHVAQFLCAISLTPTIAAKCKRSNALVMTRSSLWNFRRELDFVRRLDQHLHNLPCSMCKPKDHQHQEGRGKVVTRILTLHAWPTKLVTYGLAYIILYLSRRLRD